MKASHEVVFFDDRKGHVNQRLNRNDKDHHIDIKIYPESIRGSHAFSISVTSNLKPSRYPNFGVPMSACRGILRIVSTP